MAESKNAVKSIIKSTFENIVKSANLVTIENIVNNVNIFNHAHCSTNHGQHIHVSTRDKHNRQAQGAIKTNAKKKANQPPTTPTQPVSPGTPSPGFHRVKTSFLTYNPSQP